MNKKGTHVDWVISMGIFTLYVFALFLFLRPGIKPVHKPVTLLDALERHFNEEVMWEIKKVPLFIRKCSGTTDTGEVANSIWIKDGGNCWSSSKVEDPDYPTKEFPGNEIVCAEADFIRSQLSIPFYFYFYTNQEEICVPNFVYDCVISNPENCEADIGVPEDIKGIRSTSFNALKSDEYDIIRSRWEGISVGKEFAIFDDDGVYIVGKKPPEVVDVFVRKITTQIVDKQGVVTPIGIFLQIW